MKSLFICFMLCLASLGSYAAEYKATLIGTESIPYSSWSVDGITDKGQLYGKDNRCQENLFFHDPKNGFISIKSEFRIHSHISLVANNNGQLAGCWEGTPGLFIWSKALGFRPINIFDDNHAEPIAFNDLGQLIGTYGDGAFLWDYGVVTYMGAKLEYSYSRESDFSKYFKSLGFCVTNLKIKAINNKGEMAGYFQYGKYSAKQKRVVPVGTKVFFWDGTAHILPIQLPVHFNEVVKLNNKSVVMASQSNYDLEEQKHIETSYLWDLESGLQILPNFYGIDLNDSKAVLGFVIDYSPLCVDYSGIIPGCALRRRPTLWKEGKYTKLATLLGVDNLESLAIPFSDAHDVEKISNVVGINNRGQIACMGYVWGEWHPCILEPVDIQM